jgi:HNH endonuclease
MTVDSITCAYCGARTTDWDHLRPLVKNKRPTGYITEIRNLVPACGPCNQSKSGNDWNAWMESAAPGSPKTREVPDLPERIERLKQFEKWGAVTPLALAELVDEGIWTKHWANLEVVLGAMKSAQTHADDLRTAIRAGLANRVKTSR